MPALPRIRVQDVEGVPLIRFLDRRLFDDSIVREAADQLFAALPTDRPITLILDFTGVDQISSAMLGKLILLQRRVDTSKGQLRLCELSPTIQTVLRTTNLDRLFAVDRDQRTAREAFGKGTPP